MQSIVRASKPTSVLRSIGPALRSAGVPPTSQTPIYQAALRRYAHESYGGDDKPQGDRPAASKTRDLEHPGPPPPNTSETAPSTGAKLRVEDQVSPKQQKQAQNPHHETESKEPSNKARPTLNDGTESPNIDAQGNPKEVPDDVKQHNKEFEERYDRAYNQIADGGKVSKGFWKGNGASLTEDQGGARRDGGN